MNITRNKTLVVLLVIVNTTVLFNTIYIQYVFNLQKEPEAPITGHATQSTLNLCIDSGFPRLDLFYPLGGNILNGTQNITSNISTPGTITNFNVTFYFENESARTLIALDTTDTDFDFNATWDTTTVNDGNCYYIIRATGVTNESLCSIFDSKVSQPFTVDNIFVEPTWNNFRNAYTTNFSTLARFSNISNVTIGTADASITFPGSYHNFDSVHIDNEIQIGYNSVNVSLTSMCLQDFTVNITFQNVSFTSVKIKRDGSDCSIDICRNVTYDGNEASFLTEVFGKFQAAESIVNISSKIDVWDSTDPELNSTEKKAFETVRFVANYTVEITDQPINGTDVSCVVQFNVSNQLSTPQNMNFNTSAHTYYYDRTFNRRGNYTWLVNCTDTSDVYQDKFARDHVIISNTPPAHTANISNLEWAENSILTGLNLLDYFSDIDSDNLSFTASEVANILVVIASDGIVSFIPDIGFFGLRRVVFFASDSINTTMSNNVTLVVTEREETDEQSTPSSGGGGGGSGGGGGGAVKLICLEEWFCDKWSVCVDGIRTRNCWDLNSCGTFNSEPPVKENCEYVPTCYNEIQDQGEEGVDCGGPCPDCFTCFDRQRNQDETDIDCGGLKCKKCAEGKKCLADSDCETDYCNPNGICGIPTCNDGWQNQDEEGVDCGGPCARKCPESEQPTVTSGIFRPAVLSGVAAILTLLLLLNIFGAMLRARAALLMMRFMRSSSIPLAEIRGDAGDLIKKINHLESILTKSNTKRIFDSYVNLFQKFFSHTFKTVSSPTLSGVKRALKKSELDKQKQKLLVLYYEKIQSYGSMPLQKKEVLAVFRYGKKLAYHLQKIKPSKK